MSRLHRNQAGLASMVIAIIISLVLSTLVIGFARIIRREQRRSLDNQLSTQAFYAAESGINDARRAIASNPVYSKTTCGPDGTLTSNTLDATNNVSYSCLLVDPTPDSLQFSGVGDNSVVYPIERADGAAIGSLDYIWQGATPDINGLRPSPTDKSFPTTTAWGKTLGVLRVELTPIANPASIDRNALIANSRVIFLYPNAGGAGTFAFPGTSGEIVNANCVGGATPTCKVTITGLTGTLYYARVESKYNLSNFDNCFDGGCTIAFKGAQSLIDATGKAQDVMRRIQVRVPTRPSVDYPEKILNSVNTLCKRMLVLPSGVQADDPDASCDPNPAN